MLRIGTGPKCSYFTATVFLDLLKKNYEENFVIQTDIEIHTQKWVARHKKCDLLNGDMLRMFVGLFTQRGKLTSFVTLTYATCRM